MAEVFMPSAFRRFFRDASVALLAGVVCLLSGESTASKPPETRNVPSAIGSGTINERRSLDGGWLLLSDRGRRRGDENRSMDQQYREWQSLPPEQKEMLRRRMERYRDLSPQERDLYQRRHQQWQELSPEERNRIQEDLKHWENLSPQERDAIRRRFGR
jgi:Protein of unknown function (DUF3106)